MNTLRSLRRRYGRTTLIVIGIALAIAFSTIMLSIGVAIQDSSKKIIDEAGVDLFVESSVDLSPLLLEFTNRFEIDHGRTIAQAMVDNNSKIREAAPWLKKNLYMAKYPDEINATDPPKFSLSVCKGFIPEQNRYFSGRTIVDGRKLPTQNDPFYANGTYLDGEASDNFTHEILLSKSLAKRLDVAVGDIIYIDPILITDELTEHSLEAWFKNATMFKVYGIMVESFESQQALMAHLHLSELQYILDLDEKDTVTSIYVNLYHRSDRENVKHWLENEFIYKDSISVHTPGEMLEDISDLTGMLEGFSRMVVIITILVAALFIGTVSMISTRERSREIGALRAIGISKFTINKFIIKESMIMCIAGLIIGFILGYIGSDIINDYIVSTQPFLPPNFRVTMITPGIVAFVTFITLSIAVLASLGPCYWAMSLKPVEALRND